MCTILDRPKNRAENNFSKEGNSFHFLKNLCEIYSKLPKSCNCSTPPGVTFTPPGVLFAPAGVEISRPPDGPRRLNSSPCHALRSPSRLPRMRIRCASSSYLEPSANEPAKPSRALENAADAPPPPLTHRHLRPPTVDPAELATPNSALRGCRARPTRSYALRKPIATPRQPRTTRVRGVRPTVSVTVSARQTVERIASTL